MLKGFKPQLLILLLFPFFSPFLATKGYSQATHGIIKSLEIDSPGSGKVKVFQDERINLLMNQYYIQNASRPGMNGFRIRIFFDLGQQSRNNSLDVMNEFMENFPGVAVYRTFDSPYYKVSVGDFRSRDEALRIYSSLVKKYPKAFIVPEWINFPPID